MHTFAVHAQFLSLAEREDAVAPSHWRHDLNDGSLTYRFDSSQNTFTWDAPAIASMPAGFGAPLTDRAKRLLERWDSVKDMLGSTDRPEPDFVLVDHDVDELRLIWKQEQAEVVVGAG